MKINLFRDPNYTFTWPTEDPDPSLGEPIPEGERIKFKCKRLGHATKRQIEDNMMNLKGSHFQRRGKKGSRGGTGVQKVSMTYAIGTTKDSQLKNSITGWENVLDSEGHTIKFSWDNLQLLLECNADLNPEVYGSLEADLLEKIQLENSFADKTSVTGKNS